MPHKAEKGVQGFRPTHGRSRTRAYQCWARMKILCTYERAPGYAYVGGRGIGFDPEWASYERFHADMGDCPDGHTLRRIQHDEGYSKNNCHWLPLSEGRKAKR